ncbi:hypothetical protein CDL15_Pgr005762 [Punica granatum]|uniref:GPI ethanolamine phosphate transferase 1 n=1 Tax=Punica granatum TaxID=22663 RepID=A0A218WFI6_PUNGR|nr:hypothetical protein CDL15_Pgr005762 [Punica granatum]
MGTADGIIGGGQQGRGSAGTGGGRGTKKKWLKRRERWLVVLGVVLHAVYMLSIFDIYFKSPIVHGMDPVAPRFSAPAKRLVFLVADGLRADKFFEPDSEGNFRAPFLRSIIKGQGRWGVSHARPPTESRPGHVALIAGFYEDPSAVTKGWKANPVEFDSVFNRSHHTISFGSPDIVPIFCSALPHSTWNSYPHEFEDFATDASFLDEWSFDQFQSLINRSSSDENLRDLLQQDNLVVFLHLLGCDSNGHAHRPFSSIYLNNVKVVDHIAKRMYDLVEGYFKDNRTAYVFTADHGMSDKGSHGDGHPTNTDTPLVVWGAGVKHPKPILSSDHTDHGLRFIDEHLHDTPTPPEWGLSTIERVDVNQADIAALMATLLGLPCPMNSVGSLPLGYVNMDKLIKALLRYLSRKKSDFVLKLLATFIVSIVLLELLVHSFTERKLYTWCFLIVGIAASSYLFYLIPWESGIPFFVWLACWFLSVFTLMPAEIPDNNKLVMEKQELHSIHQFLNWCIAGLSIILPLFSENVVLSRLTSVYLGFAPTFLLLSIGYEAVFYGALGLVLMAWLLFENTLLYVGKVEKPSTANRTSEEHVSEDDVRYLQLSDARIPLIFLVLFNVAFFGTGNFASIASFEISSVYRFITIFSPFLMAALLIFKLFIPFMLVICTFSAIAKLIQVTRSGCYFLVILFSDVMTIHFFFLVKNKGSWMEIGNSISHFGIVSAQVVFVLLLFALTDIYTKDIQVMSNRRPSSRKAV